MPVIPRKSSKTSGHPIHASQESQTHEAFAQRLRSLIELNGGSILRLAQAADVSDTTIHVWLRGSEPSREKLVAIADATGVSVEWLATGRGEMRADQRPLGYRFLKAVPSTDASGKVVDIRGSDYIAFKEEWLATLPGSDDPASLVLIQASGDAMAPTIQSSDFILINFADGRRTLRDGLYAIIYAMLAKRSSSLLIRRLKQRIDGSFDVICDNPAYSTDDPFTKGFHPNTTLPEPDVMFARLVWFSRVIM